MSKELKKTGTREWSDVSLNIARGCPNDCRYCYARWAAVNRYKTKTAANWPTMELCEPAVIRQRIQIALRKPGVIMFPTAHDIKPEILHESIAALRELLLVGRKVLIVTKPDFECVSQMCIYLNAFKTGILFRFTIGSDDDKVLNFWEPGAPRYQERLQSLRYAYDHNFSTSVSCEPYLDENMIRLFQQLNPYITDSFWIGKLNKLEQRVDLTGVENSQYVELVKRISQDYFVKGLYNALKYEPLVKWKDSIREIIGLPEYK